MGLAGHFVRIDPGPIGRLQRIGAPEHPAVGVAALGRTHRRQQAGVRMAVSQVQRDRRRLGQYQAINHQRRHHTGRIQRQVVRRLVLARVEIQQHQFVLDAQLDQQPVHDQRGGTGRTIQRGAHAADPVRLDRPIMRPCAGRCSAAAAHAARRHGAVQGWRRPCSACPARVPPAVRS
ncbi:hypothetical protein G6F59_015453 [Rhizopus arrhizus]|nr:hypothetical protein G6F59_015453 [Rhizopus arrhizus]